jgi:hypothetical protein
VFGCQRSGTTMLQQSLLDRSWRCIILDEHDRRLVRATDPERLRWDDAARVAARLRAMPFELVVAKPLVESHRVGELLDSCAPAGAIWMLRHYRSVARSNLQRFGPGNGMRDLRLMVGSGPADWRGCVPDQVSAQVAGLLESGLSPLDAAAVFWWARNMLYVEQQLWADSRVRVLRYEAMIDRPAECLAALGEFVGLRFPLDAMTRGVRPARAPQAELRSDVEELCAGLFASFDGFPALPGGGGAQSMSASRGPVTLAAERRFRRGKPGEPHRVQRPDGLQEAAL